jgi:hypothetical protein
MVTPITKVTNAGMDAIVGTALGLLKPYQIEQTMDFLNRIKWDRGSNSDISVQPTINTIITALGSNEP